MGYAEYMRSLIKPLGVYGASGVFAPAEIEAVGAALDGVDESEAALEREVILRTAEDWGLSLYEEILPFRPAAEDVAARRGAIQALLAVNGRSTLADINKTLLGCGVPAVAEETGIGTVRVYFPEIVGEPENLAELESRILMILPSHLGIFFDFDYPSWEVIESIYPTWNTLESRISSWYELQSRVN